MPNKDVAMYLHCRACLESNAHPQNLEVGLTPDGVISVWCRRHDLPVGDFALTDNPLEGVECHECGAEAKADAAKHKH